jgi:dihydropteroate synthase
MIGKDGALDLGQRTAVVGVLNVTPDSFSDGGRYLDCGAAIDRAVEMEAQGANIVEIGGESTRPGARAVQEDVELSRLIPVLERLVPKIRIPVAVDTYKSQVARVAIDLGAQVINDVSALRFDPGLAEVCAAGNAVIVLMHMRGKPETMQKMEPSPDILAEIESDLTSAARQAAAAGISGQRIILDPGIGFGKTLEQNLEIINNLDRLSNLGYPLMVGTSRKGFIGKLTGRPESQRQFGTAATVAAAVLNGAHLVRVHDVKEMVDVVKVADALARIRSGPSTVTAS